MIGSPPANFRRCSAALPVCSLPVIFPGRISMYLHAGARDFVFDGAEDADGEVVRLLKRLVGFDFEGGVEELERAGAARPQVVEAVDALVAETFDDGGDLRVYRAREPPVHQ